MPSTKKAATPAKKSQTAAESGYLKYLREQYPVLAKKNPKFSSPGNKSNFAFSKLTACVSQR